jgi:hypothetical protein
MHGSQRTGGKMVHSDIFWSVESVDVFSCNMLQPSQVKSPCMCPTAWFTKLSQVLVWCWISTRATIARRDSRRATRPCGCQCFKANSGFQGPKKHQMTLVTDWWLFPVWRTGFKIQEFPSACNPCSLWWWNSFLIVLCCTSNVHKEDFGDPGNSNIDDIHDIQKFRQIRQSFEGPWGSSRNPCTGLNIATGYFDAVPDIPLEARWVLLQESRKSSPHKKSATQKINRKGGSEGPNLHVFWNRVWYWNMDVGTNVFEILCNILQ